MPGPPGQQPIGPPGAMPMPGAVPGGAAAGPSGLEVVQPPLFVCPRRPNIGSEGRIITLRANHFQITMPRGFLHHYDITITPDKCPRKINRYVDTLFSCNISVCALYGIVQLVSTKDKMLHVSFLLIYLTSLEK